MAELAVGVIGLAGLFSSAVDAMKLVHLIGNKDLELQVLHTQLENQKARVHSWGAGTTNLRDLEAMSGVDGAVIQQAVARTIVTVTELFRNVKTLENRHISDSVNVLPQERANLSRDEIDGLVTEVSAEDSCTGDSSDGPRQESGDDDMYYDYTDPREKQSTWVSSSLKARFRVGAPNRLRATYNTLRWITADLHRLRSFVSHLQVLNDDLDSLAQRFSQTSSITFPHYLGNNGFRLVDSRKTLFDWNQNWATTDLAQLIVFLREAESNGDDKASVQLPVKEVCRHLENRGNLIMYEAAGVNHLYEKSQLDEVEIRMKLFFSAKGCEVPGSSVSSRKNASKRAGTFLMSTSSEDSSHRRAKTFFKSTSSVTANERHYEHSRPAVIHREESDPRRDERPADYR